MRQRVQIFLGLVLGACVLSGCLPSPYFQKNTPMPKGQWAYAYQPSYRFEIKDTAAVYNLYFLIRHTELYPFSNIWLNIYTKMPGDTSFQETRIEIPLAEASGKWLGRGMGDVWEQRMPITRNDAPMIFAKAGTYEIRFEQAMRVNPLPEIMNVGLRVEKKGRKI
jgi:gliding motility-associated lipoprotein GldH